MPSFFPSGNTAEPGDDEARSAKKLNSLLYDSLGDKGPSYFPEGSRPLPTDDLERSLQKIDALMS